MAMATVLFFRLSLRSENLMYTLSNETDTQGDFFLDPLPKIEIETNTFRESQCVIPLKTKKEKSESIQDILYYIL